MPRRMLLLALSLAALLPAARATAAAPGLDGINRRFVTAQWESRFGGRAVDAPTRRGIEYIARYASAHGVDFARSARSGRRMYSNVAVGEVWSINFGPVTGTVIPITACTVVMPPVIGFYYFQWIGEILIADVPSGFHAMWTMALTGLPVFATHRSGHHLASGCVLVNSPFLSFVVGDGVFTWN